MSDTPTAAERPRSEELRDEVSNLRRELEEARAQIAQRDATATEQVRTARLEREKNNLLAELAAVRASQADVPNLTVLGVATEPVIEEDGHIRTMGQIDAVETIEDAVVVVTAAPAPAPDPVVEIPVPPVDVEVSPDADATIPTRRN